MLTRTNEDKTNREGQVSHSGSQSPATEKQAAPVRSASSWYELVTNMGAGERNLVFDAYFKDLEIIFSDAMKWKDKPCWLDVQVSLIFDF